MFLEQLNFIRLARSDVDGPISANDYKPCGQQQQHSIGARKKRR